MKNVILFLFLFSFVQAYAFESFKVKEDPSLIFRDLDLTEESPLYREILGYLNANHQQIAQRQLREIDNGLKAWGGLNHVGLSFSKGFGDFSIELKRQVAPDLFDDERWLVTDTFDIYIDASHVLSNLKDQEVIDISEKNLALFAGITFKRSYTHVHFADTYEKALGFNLDKLFFSFKNYQNANILNLAPSEFIKKEDSFSLQAGGLGSIPITSGLAAHVGALLTYQKLGITTVLGVSEEDASYQGERLRISSEKSKEVSAGVTAGLVADFLGLLQISLLKFDFSYGLKDSYKLYLSFSQNDLLFLKENPDVFSALTKTLKHQLGRKEVLLPYLVSEEQRRLETSKLKYSVLIYGGFKNIRTEHIDISKGGNIYTFFRHNYERSRYKENVFSRLFHVLMKAGTKLSSFINRDRFETDNVRVEYESSHNLIETKGDLVFNQEKSNLSLNFMRDFYAYKLRKKEKKRVLDLLDHFSGADPRLADQIEKGLVSRSVSFNTMFSMGGEALENFHNLSKSKVYKVFEESCEASRSGLKSFFGRFLKTCERSLKKSYDLYQKERLYSNYTSALYISCERDLLSYKSKRRRTSARRKRMFLESCLQKKAQKSVQKLVEEIPLWQLSFLMRNIHKRVPSKVHFYQLFGFKNVFVHGEFTGKNSQELSVNHHFREGLFKGLGTVSNSMKSLGLRAPANVNSL